MTATTDDRRAPVVEEAPHQERGPSAEQRRAVVRFAVMGTVLLAMALLFDVQRLGGHPLGLVQPGAEGPAAELFAEDFPDVDLPDSVGLDGQMTYAMARDPWSVDASQDSLDRPRYRLQRALPAWIAGTVHPGSGIGLVWTILLVGLLAVGAGAWAVGRLSVGWDGPPWIAAVFPILPGAFMALRVSTADAIGIALALLAVALAARDRTGWAVAAGVVAVLAKEPSLLILAGWALAHRTPRHLAVVVVPGAVAGAWMLALRLLVPGAESLNGDIGAPGAGLFVAARDIWLDGREQWGMVSTIAGLAIAVFALWRAGLRHPLGWALALNLAFVLVAGPNPLGTSFGGTRTSLALMAVALVVLATPHATDSRGGDEIRRAPA